MWRRKPTIIIGGGPSLKEFDLEVLQGKVHAIAVKGAIFDYPWADVGFGLDTIELRKWWKRLRDVNFPIWWAVPDTWTVNRLSFPPRNLHYLRRDTKLGLSDNPSVIHGGGTSGFGAFNFAYLKGATKIVLFGFDYGPNDEGEWHANQRHYDPNHQYDFETWKAWAASFNHVIPQMEKSNIEVTNASPTSRIEVFKRVSVEEGIAQCLR
jgi:hypothetical protein